MKRKPKTKLRDTAVLATKQVIRWCGPVAGAVKGELSTKETARSAAKFAAVWFAGGATAAATLKDPDFVNSVLAPLGGAFLAGVMDAMSRLEQGAPKPPDLPAIVPLAPTPPVASAKPSPKAVDL